MSFSKKKKKTIEQSSIKMNTEISSKIKKWNFKIYNSLSNLPLFSNLYFTVYNGHDITAQQYVGMTRKVNIHRGGSRVL